MDIINNFIQWGHQELKESPEALEYLYSRGASDALIDSLNLGYVSSYYIPTKELDLNHTEECAEDKNKTCDSCRFHLWAGVSEEEGQSSIKNSIIYPLTSYSGMNVGFQIRSVTQKRYNTFLRKNRPEAYFFGTGYQIQKIWNTNTVCLVEGPSDCITLSKFIHMPVLALTTNSSNDGQNAFLRRFCSKVYLFLDNDKAGKEGALKIKGKLEDSNVDISLVDWSAKHKSMKDLNDLWKSLGDVKFRDYIRSVMTHV